MERVVKIKQSEEAPIATEVIAESIKSIADGMKRIRAGRLNDKALFLLIQHACPAVGNSRPGIAEVRAVLEGIESLEREYLKKQIK